jgi:hypothetical protein
MSVVSVWPSTAFDISLFAASLYALRIAQAGSLIRQALNRNIRTFRRDSRRFLLPPAFPARHAGPRRLRLPQNTARSTRSQDGRPLKVPEAR